MRTRTRGAAFLLIGAALTLPCAVSGQGQGANASASDAMVLLRAGPLTMTPGENPRIREDLPSGFQAELLPNGATVQVSSVSSSLTVVVASVKSDTLFNRSRWEWKVEDAGWVIDTTVSGFFLSFVPDTRVCRAGNFATLSVGGAASGARLVRVAVGPDNQQSCTPQRSRTFRDVPLPILTLPPGVSSNGSGGGGGVDEMSYGARLETTLPIETLTNQFVDDFKAAGWKIEAGPTNDGVMSVTRLSNFSRAGDVVTAQLILTALQGTRYVDAMARFIRNKPSRVP